MHIIRQEKIFTKTESHNTQNDNSPLTKGDKGGCTNSPLTKGDKGGCINPLRTFPDPENTLPGDPEYRFGYQEQEKDDEIYGGTGNSYSFKHRMYDSRSGRFWSLDPIASKYPYNSPYAFSENRVIDAIELEGLEVVLIGQQYSMGYYLGGHFEAGIAVGLKKGGGIAMYASAALGVETNISVFQGISITVYTTMPFVELIQGEGVDLGVAGSLTPQGFGGSLGFNASLAGDEYSGYLGFNFTAGWAASRYPAEASGYATYTWTSSIKNNENTLKLLRDGKSAVDKKINNLKMVKNMLHNPAEEDVPRWKKIAINYLSEKIESLTEVSKKLEEAANEMEEKINRNNQDNDESKDN